ncbi:CMRF35-like molecule 5 isoform X3 [Pristis pectinata]|uniref:CMRF35-like molecule 5 isoform X2 n=1 Tax=Pristis pectinata TaxID=685728 RepID=UPI00223E2824|nr:CMRF35-like molecule 5 isoform X2 [Pristis pectinata]XP_051890307.1 CMRF35-like molecule 5 isoform X3 [Pristis pectinata]
MEVVQGESTHQKRPKTTGTIVLLVLISVDFISGSNALTGPENVLGVLGQSVTVECRYDRKYRDNKKQWRKGYYYATSSVVSTHQPQRGTTSMTDNKKERRLSVTMDNLMKSDEGWYWCVIVKGTFEFNEKFRIRLKVSEDPDVNKPTTETSTATTWTTLYQNRTSTSKAGSSETSVSSPQPRSVTQRDNSALRSSTTALRRQDLLPWQVVLSVALIVLCLLLVSAVIVCIKIRQKKKTGPNGQRVNGVENPAESFTEIPVVYSSVKHHRAAVESTYMNLQDLNAQGKAKMPRASETVVYSAVAH